DLLTPRGTGSHWRSATGFQPHDRAAEQTHDHFRAQDYPSIPRQASDRHRRHQPSQSGDAQPLQEWLHQQYVRDNRMLRTEAATNNVKDYGVQKGMENLPALREKLQGITNRYLDVQQDILESFIDRDQLRKLSEPTRSGLCVMTSPN